MAEKTFKRWLVVRADGEVRVSKGGPRTNWLRTDEIAVPIVITVPAGWGQVTAKAVAIQLPQPPVVESGEIIAGPALTEGTGQ